MSYIKENTWIVLLGSNFMYLLMHPALSVSQNALMSCSLC